MYQIFLTLLIVSVGTSIAYGEELIITETHRLDDVIYDGVWSYKNEWKPSSLTYAGSNNTSFVIRYAHDTENLFFLVSAISDETPDRLSDKAMICIDGKSNRGKQPSNDDYCFIAKMNSDVPLTLQGGGHNAQSGFYKKVNNHPDLIAVGGISNNYDRYSKIPHSSYEFKIPLELFPRLSSYPVYVGLFDSDSSKSYGWPNEAKEDKYPFIPAPDLWGLLISPDKSLPEFYSPIIGIFTIFSFIILLTKFSKLGLKV